jgi:hypothetical protein
MFLETPVRGVSEYLTTAEWEPSGTTTTLPVRATLSAGVTADRIIRAPFPNGEVRVTVHGEPPAWLVRVLPVVGDVLSLPPNWDSYGAPRVAPACVAAALRWLVETLRDDTPTPSIVPTSRGGVQIEWHTRGIDMEIEVVTPSRMRGAYEDHRTGHSWEADLKLDPKRLMDALATLSRQP